MYGETLPDILLSDSRLRWWAPSVCADVAVLQYCNQKSAGANIVIGALDMLHLVARLSLVLKA